MIARLFPSRKDFVDRVAKGFDLPIPREPFANDVLTRRSDTEIEFTTAARKEGAGTTGSVKANSDPIHGLVMLLGDIPNMLTLSMRLPGASAELRATIAQWVRSDWNRRR
ncbi:MAG: hypothetical protein FJW38_11660 [Acidobacteria bacterium]|nr:hypothetical protein [Acidobacteriota bacterium]